MCIVKMEWGCTIKARLKEGEEASKAAYECN